MKKPRISEDQLRELLLAEGREQLAGAGSTNGVPRIDRVTLAGAIESNELISRSSAYRLYRDAPEGQLEAFRTAVLNSIAENDEIAQALSEEEIIQSDACVNCGRLLDGLPCGRCGPLSRDDLNVIW